jgi:hypothetical protein
VEATSLNGHDVLFALKENAIHRRFKPEDPSTESNLHQFGEREGEAFGVELVAVIGKREGGTRA